MKCEPSRTRAHGILTTFAYGGIRYEGQNQYEKYELIEYFALKILVSCCIAKNMFEKFFQKYVLPQMELIFGVFVAIIVLSQSKIESKKLFFQVLQNRTQEGRVSEKLRELSLLPQGKVETGN